MNRSSARMLNFARRGAIALRTVFVRQEPSAEPTQKPPEPVEAKSEADPPPLEFDAFGDAAGDAIRHLLEAPGPAMVARIGHTELKAMLRYRMRTELSPLGNAWRYITAKQGVFWWDEPLRWEMQFSSGFFPCTDELLERFAQRYMSDLGFVDILGSWQPGERELRAHFPTAMRIPLPDVEPFFHKIPWSAALAGKRVLVVQPFESTIREQYAKRRLLFADPRVLPDFELITLRAVQSLGGQTHGFATWFDALDSMCEAIDKIEFDIALIGAGAYGLPLAAYVKRLGRKAVHLGGASQLIFGIRGKRWEDWEHYRKLMNEHWVRPKPEETPTGHEHVDHGKSYW